MMTLAQSNRLMLPESVPTTLVFLMAVAGIAAWVGAHAIKRRFVGRWPQIILFALRVLVGGATLFAAAQALQRVPTVVVLGTSWPIWPIALIGALCVEGLVVLYELERRTVSRRSGMTLICLRVALVLLVVLMLTQPVKSLPLAKTFRRVVAILVDDSASMHIPEAQLTPPEKIRRAEMLGIETRPYRLERVHQRLSRIRQDLIVQHEWLRTVGGSAGRDLGKQLARRADPMNDALTDAREGLVEQVDALAALLVGKLKLDPQTRKRLTNLKAALHVRARGRLQEAIDITEDDDQARLHRQFDKLKAGLGQAIAALTESVPQLQALAEQIDTTYYNSLPAERRKRIDALSHRTRFQLARELLLREGAVRDPDDEDSDRSLLEILQEDHLVKVYTFAAKAQSVEVKHWRQSATRPAAALPTRQQETNIAAALKELMKQSRGRSPAGVVLLSDGRHNTPDRVEELAHDLGVQGVPICSVAFGGKNPPRDAAVVSIEPPETVYAGDKVSVKVELKLDALAGEVVKVVLYDGKDPVAEELVRVPRQQARLRKKIELTAEPKDPGQHHYRVSIEAVEGGPIDGEVFSANNEYGFAVTVSRDRTKLLIVEGRPRWEFRYIKNLFDSRDRAVRLQYVLLEPDQILGQPPRPEVRASASRPERQTEATALPKDLEEWLKFDAIILGDVSPEFLEPDGTEALGKFVRDRGGTLIVISGQRFMPHAYANTAMEDLLPVELVKPRPGTAVMDSGDPSFRIRLTSEGRENILMRQHVEPKENQAIWDALPDVYWRYPGSALKGTLVLAYAMPPQPPEFVKKAATGTLDDKELQALREFQRERSLITIRRLEPGKVMFLSFDRTWRLRYRVGDTYHHRFWGQVLRWATAEKLPAGTDLVKIGTNRSRYSPRENIRVRVKIVRPDFSPVVSEEVAVNVFAEDKRVLRKKLEFVKDSPGIYTADLGELPSGSYRAELDAPVAKPLLERDNVDKVATLFSVDPAAPAEQIELAADRGLLNRLATLSGGIMVEPYEAHELLDVLGEQERVDPTPRQYPLWNSWPLLILIVLIATGEWLLRKRVGLA